MNRPERAPLAWSRPGKIVDGGKGACLSKTLGMALVLSAVSLPTLAGAPVLGGKTPVIDTAPAVQLVQAQRNNRAREQAIILRLEEEIRRLNGRIEELEFRQRQTDNRLNELIEQQTAGPEVAGNDTENGQNSVLLEQTARSPEDAIRDLAEQAARFPSEEPEEGGLGRVPESAVASLPRPNPADIAVPERSTLSAEQQYENAVQLLQAGNYKGAQDGLEVFLDLHEDHQLASNAAYWLAETHYVRQNYAAAAAAFARNYGTYGKDSPKAIDNLLKLGMSLSNLGESDKACLSYDELKSSFPNPPAQIEQALNRERARAQCS